MGKQAAIQGAAPPAGDRANAYQAGVFTAIGPSDPVPIYGAFNILLWAQTAAFTLTTTAKSLAATASSGTGLVVGQTIVSKNVPKGTTIAAIAGGVNLTLALPPSATADQIIAGADAAAISESIAWGTSKIQLERSFDGGSTWLACGIGGGGQIAQWTNTTTVSVVASEPELGVYYRLNCVDFSGAINVNYRLSQSGLGAMAWGVPGC